MAKYYNPGNVNIQAAIDSILAEGGGIKETPDWDGKKYAPGITHVSVYSTKAKPARHFSFNVDEYGTVTEVHSSIRGNSFYDYGNNR